MGADPRVAPREGLGLIDPSGLVKGWALDRAGDMLRGATARNFAVNAGGDVIVAGHPEPGALWRVGVQHPQVRSAVACVVAVTDAAVATSGRYERGDHILDPRTGRPATALSAVTVIGPSLAVADGRATGVLALGDDAGRWMGEHPEIAVLTIADDATVTTTPAFDGHRTTA